ncbi:hypothetical protein P691DRAFT_682872, partial [Macrolepiota fuliginosa MF-IS2]
DCHGEPSVQVISIDSIVWAAHLLPVYGCNHVPKDIILLTVLSYCRSLFVNHFIDHYVYELITSNIGS